MDESLGRRIAPRRGSIGDSPGEWQTAAIRTEVPALSVFPPAATRRPKAKAPRSAAAHDADQMVARDFPPRCGLSAVSCIPYCRACPVADRVFHAQRRMRLWRACRLRRGVVAQVAATGRRRTFEDGRLAVADRRGWSRQDGRGLHPLPRSLPFAGRGLVAPVVAFDVGRDARAGGDGERNGLEVAGWRRNWSTDLRGGIDVASSSLGHGDLMFAHAAGELGARFDG